MSMAAMRPCHVVEIVTPKKYILNGLWFGPRKPRQAIIWVHGLGGSAFSMRSVIGKIVDKSTAVLTFNNHGFEKISEIKRKVGRKSRWVKGGAAHEVFTDCTDDIQGAVNFVRKTGVKNIYLAGHSTGCQKSVYWASRTHGGRDVKGIVLFAPISDFAAETKRKGKEKIRRATLVARALMRRGRGHTLLPEGLWHEVLDAQRFLSLYTSDSAEEVFSYAQPKKIPRTLKSVFVPILVLWAEKDEYADRPAKKIAAWFEKHIRAPHRVVIVPKTGHSFKGGEKTVARAIRQFMAPKMQ